MSWNVLRDFAAERRAKSPDRPERPAVNKHGAAVTGAIAPNLVDPTPSPGRRRGLGRRRRAGTVAIHRDSVVLIRSSGLAGHRSSLVGCWSSHVVLGTDALCGQTWAWRAPPTRRRTTEARPVLYESVWLLDLHAAIPAPASGSLVHAVEAARDACSSGAAARGVSIAFADPPALRVAIDADRLTLVLVNLIENAIKHGRPGGGVFVGIHLDDERLVRITVDDDGPGIAADDRERVFVFGDRGVTDATGTGIGLALVRLMIERAGGRVDLETSPLGGARFVLAIPRA